MQALLLTTLYAFLLLWLVWRWRWMQVPGLGRQVPVALFGLKALAALLYGFYHRYIIGGGDTFLLISIGDEVAAHFTSDPLLYLWLVLGPNGGFAPDAYLEASQHTGFWHYTPSYLMVRLNAVIRLFSFGVFEVHALWYAFLVFIAQFALLKHLARAFSAHLLPLTLAVFCTPTVLFYGSGMHKEGLVIIGLCLVVVHLGRVLTGGWRQWSLLWLACGLFLLYLVKDMYLAALLPCLAAWVWVHYYPRHAGWKIALTLVAVWTAMFHLHYLAPGLDATGRIAEKQAEFRIFRGATNVPLPVAEPTFTGVASTLPYGFVNAFLRPWPWAWHNAWAWCYGLENMAVFLLSLLALWHRLRGHRPVVLAVLLLVFSVTAITLIGTIVPNLGAISRYRAPALMALVVALVLMVPAERWQRWLGRFGLVQRRDRIS